MFSHGLFKSCGLRQKNDFARREPISESGQEKTAVSLGRIVTEVYPYFVQSFKDFIFRKKLLLLALVAHRMHRKR